jgi:hypothetical protein
MGLKLRKLKIQNLFHLVLEKEPLLYEIIHYLINMPIISFLSSAMMVDLCLNSSFRKNTYMVVKSLNSPFGFAGEEFSRITVE